MPLASKDGKLYFKTVIVDGVEKIQLCSSCCSAEVIGCCYTYSYDNAGNPIFIVSKDTYSGCEEIQKQVDPSFDVVWSKLDDPSAECPENPPDPGPGPGPGPDPPTGACCYPDGDIPAHCHDGKTQAECESEGGTWHEGKVCNEDGECPPVDPPPPAGRCCLYKGEPLDMACGETYFECKDNAEEIKASVAIGFYEENDIVFNEDGDEGCQYTVMVYQYIPEAVVPICHDEDKNGNPITEDSCEELNTAEVYKAVFTEGEDCGETSVGGRGTCSDQPPTDQRSNPLP